MVEIVDGTAENCRNVIIMVSFRSFLITTCQGFFDFVESLQQTKIQDKVLQNFRLSCKCQYFTEILYFHFDCNTIAS
jgi:hypothetical protein